MNVQDLCRVRNIPKNKGNTPILVPSFSSTIYGISEHDKKNEIGEMYNFIKNKLTNSQLISVFDIHHNYINYKDIKHTRNLILDSGCYEYECYKKAGQDIEWDINKYYDTLSTLNINKNVILVSYDNYNDIEKQLNIATKIFNNYPACISDFIIKPHKKYECINVESIINNLDSLKDFNILGISEKELGDSLISRCNTIIQLRAALNERGLNTPLHVFGCLDFFRALSYFICGADIFDGLCWLRYSYFNNVPIHMMNYGLIEGLIKFDEYDIYDVSYIHNLLKIDDFLLKMKKYSTNYDLSIFNIPKNILDQLNLLISYSGIELGP